MSLQKRTKLHNCLNFSEKILVDSEHSTYFCTNLLKMSNNYD